MVTNTILWGNSAPEGSEIWLGVSSELSIYYSDVEGGEGATDVESGSTLNWGEGMIASDPLFFEPDSSDYHLQFASPCIDAGDPSSPNVPWGGWRRDMGVFEYDMGFYHNGSALIRKPVESETASIVVP